MCIYIFMVWLVWVLFLIIMGCGCGLLCVVVFLGCGLFGVDF